FLTGREEPVVKPRMVPPSGKKFLMKPDLELLREMN
ncbi:hypothetical protein IYC_06194, partial [Clostridium sporogenes PA 3679]